MKKNILKGIGIVLATAFMISGCQNKANDWNLNPVPSIGLSNIKVLKVADALPTYQDTEVADELVISKGDKVILQFDIETENRIKQVSYHDGTWGASMYLINSMGDTTMATPPQSTYRPENTPKQEDIDIFFDGIEANTVFSMIVSDAEGLSKSYTYKIKVQ